MNKELAKTLTTALVQFIDRERPEGSMACSSAECERIEKAFEGGLFDVVENTIKRKLTDLTEFESSLRQIIEVTLSDEVPNGSGGTMSWAVALSDNDIKKLAPKVLAIAKNELLSFADKRNPAIEAMADLERAVTCGNIDNIPKWLVEELNKAFKKGQELSHEDYVKGYANGYKDAEKRYNESVAYHFPIMPTTPSGWGCDGIHCTNPHGDCINCPRRFSSGGAITTPNTASGTSTATLHGNTSATDGKEHNPSFTD